jgi:4-hydroxy-2-oxoheptanedioate aldolase
MPPRINRAIEKLQQGQPVFGISHRQLSYEAGRSLAGTWADYLDVDMEHHPFDMRALQEFMQGLVDGGPTPSGHRSPAVIVDLPVDGSSEAAVRANSWMFKQALARGVHGILLCHAEDPRAVRAFVEACRYPLQAPPPGLDRGRRGRGGEDSGAAIWGISPASYMQRADPWPLNPSGELLLGIKTENVRALEQAERSLTVPGIAFVDWGPYDLSASYGYPTYAEVAEADFMQAARRRVFAAARQAGVFFTDVVRPDTVVQRIEEGVRICACRSEAEARIGREYATRR